MRTRTLHTIATCQIITGLTAAAAGLHPRIPDNATRAGALVLLSALPVIVAAQVRRCGATADQIAAARNAGYRLGLTHAALGLLNSPDGGTPNSYARGNLHVITSEHPTPERKAQ